MDGTKNWWKLCDNPYGVEIMPQQDLRMIGWCGFIPSERYEVNRDEMWTYETKTAKGGYDENGLEIFTVTMHLQRPEKCIASRDNAHP